MESSATKGLFQVQNWVKLKRDKSNYVPWQRSVKEALEAVGCEAAITEDFAKLHFKDKDYDYESSGDDSDDFLSKPRFPSPMPRQRTPYSFPNLPAFFNFIYASKRREERKQ